MVCHVYIKHVRNEDLLIVSGTIERGHTFVVKLANPP